MDEQQWVRWLSRKARPQAQGRVVEGIGDDCAIVSPEADQEWLFTTDMLVEDVHFRRSTHTAVEVGHKTLARGLSDLAAMGGAPRFCLVSLAVAPWSDDHWIKGFYQGLLALARRTGTTLVGGDLSHSPQLVCDVVAVGAVPHGRAIRRSGAKPGDQIYVSGRLGGSALGLETQAGPAWKRHKRPEPRLDIGAALPDWGATAAMDLSDGLSSDLQRLARASGVTAHLDRIPVYRGASLEQALHGGEDYELLFCLPPENLPPQRLGTVPITRIGEITARSRADVYWRGQPLHAAGYDHFRAGYAGPHEPVSGSDS